MTTSLLKIIACMAGVASFAVPARRSAHGTGAVLPCMVPGPESVDLVQSIKKELISPDSPAVLWRNGFGMAGIDTASVAVVTDTVVCTRVTRVVDSATRQPPATEAHLVILRVGPRFVSFYPFGKAQSLFILDTNYVFLYFVP